MGGTTWPRTWLGRHQGAPHSHDDKNVMTKVTMVARAMTIITTWRPWQPGPQRQDDNSRGYPTPNHPQWQWPDEGAPYGSMGDRCQGPNEVPTAAVGEMAATRWGTQQQHGGGEEGKRWLWPNEAPNSCRGWGWWEQGTTTATAQTPSLHGFISFHLLLIYFVPPSSVVK